MPNRANDFIVKAGPRALEIIRDEGLRPERVRVVAGAAGLYHKTAFYILHASSFRTPLFFNDGTIMKALCETFF